MSGQRPSHEHLMRAQEALGDARDAEQKAGNLGAAMVLNDVCLSVFQIALLEEFDALANRAFADRFPDQRQPTGEPDGAS